MHAVTRAHVPHYSTPVPNRHFEFFWSPAVDACGSRRTLLEPSPARAALGL